MTKDIRFIINTIHSLYPQQTTELVYQTPFQLMVAVILSAQATDRQVNIVTKSLFLTIRWPQDIIDMWKQNLQKAIKSIGLYHTKAHNIFTLSQTMVSDQYIANCSDNYLHPHAQHIYDKYKYRIPDSIHRLVDLPGVGIKSAKVIWQILYNLPVIAVDTHVHRVCNRVGIVQTQTPQQTDKQLQKIIPPDLVSICHHSIVLFGRYHCKALKPLCYSCPLTSVCTWYQHHTRVWLEQKNPK